jgi:NAD(P)-dependent dehydrogenase (short-subunit alcohol dehydrogenase family)
MSRRLEGKVAIVIGAGSSGKGLSNGQAAALAYAREGASVLAADFDLQRAEETVGIITSEGHVACSLRADATSEEDVEAVMARAVEAFGGVDIVHNNVGCSGVAGPILGHSLADWRREMTTSLDSAFLGVRAAITRLRARGGGSITNISTVVSTRFLKGSSGLAYSVAKAGVETLTRACALEYGPENIRVNCIRIGFCDSPLLRHDFEVRGVSGEELEAALDERARRTPLRRSTRPMDIGAAAVFLASDEARQITGLILPVDGGDDVAPI